CAHLFPFCCISSGRLAMGITYTHLIQIYFIKYKYVIKKSARTANSIKRMMASMAVPAGRRLLG
ncbi:MAG: hypothetical protein PUE57_05765, partial [Lactimicrobium massiliense]